MKYLLTEMPEKHLCLKKRMSVFGLLGFRYIHPCEICGRIFNSIGNLERHKLIHTGKNVVFIVINTKKKFLLPVVALFFQEEISYGFLLYVTIR